VGASLLEHDPLVGETFAFAELFTIDRTVSVRTIELDRAIAEYNIPQPTFLKCDVEGAELEILQGGSGALENVVAVKTEVAFIPQRKGQPLAADIESFLAKRGFVLMDFIEPHRWRRYSTTPSPYVSRDRIPFSAGQLVQGDYLFFRNPDGLETQSEEEILQNLRAALMALCYGYFDHAHSLLSRERVREFLADRYSLDVSRCIERSSRFYGRQVAKRTVLEHLRDLIPLTRSLARTYIS